MLINTERERGGGGEQGSNVDDNFYIMLFSALEQIHCAFVIPVKQPSLYSEHGAVQRLATCIYLSVSKIPKKAEGTLHIVVTELDGE